VYDKAKCFLRKFELNELIVLMVIPEVINAESLGANTVYGPVPLSVVARFALTTAASRIVKLDPEATS
jgi:hypothetical protein